MADTVRYNLPGGLLVSGGVLQVGTLVATSGVDVGGTLTVSGTAEVTSGLAAGALTVSATGYFGSGLTAGGLAVSGNATVASGIIGGALNVSGNTAITSGHVVGNLTVSGRTFLIGGGLTAGLNLFSGALPPQATLVSYTVPVGASYDVVTRLFSRLATPAGSAILEVQHADVPGLPISDVLDMALGGEGASGYDNIREIFYYLASGSVLAMTISGAVSGQFFVDISIGALG